MTSKTKTKIIKIGNSQGIRIPKSFLAESKLDMNSEVELSVDAGGLRICSYNRFDRSTWKSKMAQEIENGGPYDDEEFSIWDETLGDGIL